MTVALIGSELGHEARKYLDFIQRLKWLKVDEIPYTDVQSTYLEFDVNDWVYMKNSPMKSVMRFGKKGKVSLHYVATF